MKTFLEYISESLEELESNLTSIGVDHSLSHNKNNNSITIHKIVVKKEQRNKGVGSKAMKVITNHADKKNLKVFLTPSSDFGGNKKRLINFYKRHGFVENKGKFRDYSTQEDMYRIPQN
jgi:predicted GNAT family N-acyltransferase